MVTRRIDGRLHFDLAAMINLIPVIMTIILSAWVLSSQLKMVEITVNGNSDRIAKLEQFKEKGDRFTAAQGKEQERRISILETVQKNNPPDWYENQVAEAFDHLRLNISNLTKDIKDIGKEVNGLRLGIGLLEQTVKTKIPNGILGSKDDEQNFEKNNG